MVRVDRKGVRLLVTGGAGFIGSNFIRYILKHHPEYTIINLDKLTYSGNRDNLKVIERSRRYSFVQGDICDPAKVSSCARKTDCIINFAAQTHVDRSILDSRDFIKTNVMGTQVLLDAARRYGHSKYIQISTDEVYGSIARGSFNEDSPLEPSSPYSASKASADLLVQAYGKTYGLPYVITRSSNNFGPYQYPEKVIPLFITNALKNKRLPLYGTGRNVRDWIYVEDHCRAIVRVLEKFSSGKVYNVGGRCEMSNIELTRKILDILGKPSSLIKKVADRAAHDFRYSLDTRKIERELGFKPRPRGEFKRSLEETVRWYRENTQWWGAIKKRQRSFQEFYKAYYAKRLR